MVSAARGASSRSTAGSPATLRKRTVRSGAALSAKRSRKKPASRGVMPIAAKMTAKRGVVAPGHGRVRRDLRRELEAREAGA